MRFRIFDARDFRQAVGLREKVFRLLPFKNNAGDSDTGDFHVPAQARQLSNAFAHQSLLIERTFAGENQVCFLKTLLQICSARENFKTRFRCGTQKRQQSEAQPASRPGSGDFREVLFQSRFRNLRKLRQGCFSGEEIFFAETFLRAVNAGRSAKTEKRILHIKGDDDFHAQIFRGNDLRQGF